MAHSFVVARFLPQRSAYWTSLYGAKKAADIDTHPFLALRIYANDMGYSNRPENAHLSMLFIVSSEKPVGASKNCFFTLAPTAENSDRVLTVTPPLSSSEHPFYLYTFPKLHADYTVSDVNISGDRFSGPHKLDEADFKIFCKSVLEDDHRREVDIPSSGGDEPVENGWDTWSGGSATGTERLRKPSDCDYELLDWRDPSTLAHPTIYNELLLYKQLGSDYSWAGTTNTISWLKDARAATCTKDILLHLIEPSKVNVRGKDAMRLYSMPIPFNGDPHEDEESDEGSGWGSDYYFPDVQRLPKPQHATPAIDVKVVALDILGTIFDREGSIRDALIFLAPLDWEKRTSRQLTQIYIECETLRLREAPDASYSTIVRTALTDTFLHLGVQPDTESLDKAVDIILMPRLRSDAIDTIHLLHKRGYTLVGIPSLDAVTFAQYFEPRVPPELTVDIPRSAWASPHAQNPALLPELLRLSQRVHPDIKPAQILIVTTGPFRMVEPACTAGFPIVLLQTASGVESKVILDTATPTLIIENLSSLCNALNEAELSDPSIVPAKRSHNMDTPYRVCGHYQVTHIIGSGSFSTVCSAFHVLTGEQVAVKREMPKNDQRDRATPFVNGESTSMHKATQAEESCLLPYEAQVYRQLRGYQAIPALHHFEMYGGAYFLILDRVGVTLDHLRQVCRGTLSLRTVAMLAMELIDRIEFVHSRGIILRDLKPPNLTMGRGNRSNLLYMLDFGLAKPFMNFMTGEHIPFRTGLVWVGTARYMSYNVHFGREPSRRDDMEALGNCLLYLFHGRLPWQGIYGPSIPAKALRIREMKAGKAFRDLLARSPPEFTAYFDHCRSLAFEDEPDYSLLRGIFQKKMDAEGWDVNGKYDWEDPKDLEKGTLLLDEYKLDVRFVKGDLDW